MCVSLDEGPERIIHSAPRVEILVSLTGVDPWEAPWESIGAMVVDGVEVGGDESSPTEAVVGSSLLALRGDLAEFEGWQVDVHVDINATNADGEFQVTLQSGEAEGSGGEVQLRSSVLF